jgi:hypothetical protein
MLEISITRDTATPMLQTLQDIVDRPEQILQVAGKRVEKELRDHFAMRNAEGNKMGWPEQGFWARIRKSTALASVDANQATIAVTDPAFNQKVYGGTITPKRVSHLAIPATAAAYAAGSPREGATPALKFAMVFDPKLWVTRPALIAAYNYQRTVQKGKKKGLRVKATAAKATTGVGTVWYWLAKKVTQYADPRALPDPQYIDDAIHDELSQMLARVEANNRRAVA